MGAPPKPATIRDTTILELLRLGHLEVDLVTAEVSFLGERIKPGHTGSYKKRPRIEFKYRGQRRTILRSRLVYLAGTRRLIPITHEIHHLDEDNTNDAFANLICLSVDDHVKLHAHPFSSQEEDIPF